MNVQRINVKMFVGAPGDLDVGPILTIFHRWRQEEGTPERWIDLADYAHVPEGPLAMIVGKRGTLVYDCEGGRPGLLYRNNAQLAGSAVDRLTESVRRALGLFERLTGEPEFPPGVRLQTDRLGISINDRLAAPNTDETHARVGQAANDLLDRLFGAGEYQATREPDPHKRYGLEVVSQSARSLSEMTARLGVAREEENTGAQAVPFRRISVQEAAQLMEREGYAYVDVRTVQEYNAGHPTGAYNVPVVEPGPRSLGLVPNLDFLRIVQAAFNNDDKIVLGCRSGGRSLRAAEILLDAGFTQLVENRAGFEAGRGPDGNIEPGWAHTDLPIATQAEQGRDYASLKALTAD